MIGMYLYLCLCGMLAVEDVLESADDVLIDLT